MNVDNPRFGRVERQPSNPLMLTKGQQQAAEDILRILEGEYKDSSTAGIVYRPPGITIDGPNLILVNGDMGVGKDTAIESIRSKIEKLGGLILHPFDLLRRDFWPEVAFSSTHVITPETEESGGGIRPDEGFIDTIKGATNSLTPREDLKGRHIVVLVNHFEAIVVYEAALSLLPDHRQIEVIVDPILDRRELKDFVNSITNQSSLTVEEIMFFSLGVPGLVEQLARSGVGVGEAKELAAWHIFTNYPRPGTWEMVNDIRRKGLDNPFMDFSETDLELFGAVNENLSRLIEDAKEKREAIGLLCEFITRKAQLLSRGFFEESPDFQTRESLGFYNRLLEENERSGPYIEVFVPQLESEAFSRIQAFLQGRSARLAMFMLKNLWKTQLMLRGADGSEIISSAFPKDVRRKRDWWEKQVSQRQPGRQAGSLYFLTYDHPKSSGASIKGAWALESLLQQIGVRYGVKYDVGDTIKIYEPDKKAFTIQDGSSSS